MDNVIFVDIETQEGLQTHAVIKHGNDQYTSMLKAIYDEQQAALNVNQL